MDEDAVHHARILAVDDDEANVHLLKQALARAGFTQAQSTTDPRQVARLVMEAQPDLVLLDLGQPLTAMRAASSPSGSSSGRP